MGPPGCFPREAWGVFPAGGGKPHCGGRSGPVMDQDGSSMPSHGLLSDLVREEGNVLWYLGHFTLSHSSLNGCNQTYPGFPCPQVTGCHFSHSCCSLVSLVSFYHLMAPITQTCTSQTHTHRHIQRQTDTHTHAQTQQLTLVLFLIPPTLRSPPHTLYF